MKSSKFSANSAKGTYDFNLLFLFYIYRIYGNDDRRIKFTFVVDVSQLRLAEVGKLL